MISINPSILNLINYNSYTILTILIQNPNKLFEILNNKNKKYFIKKN